MEALLIHERKPDRRVADEELAIEVAVRRFEARDFCQRIRPRLVAMTPGAIELGPHHYQNLRQCLAWLDSYEARQGIVGKA